MHGVLFLFVVVFDTAAAAAAVALFSSLFSSRSCALELLFASKKFVKEARNK